MTKVTVILGWKLYTTDLKEAKNATDGNDTANAVYFEPGSDGKLLKCTVNSLTNSHQPNMAKQKFDTTNLSTCYLVPTGGNGSSNYYELTNDLPIEVFTSAGVSLGKFANFADAATAARNESTKNSAANIVLLDDIFVTAAASISDAFGTITVDLNGKVLTKAAAASF